MLRPAVWEHMGIVAAHIQASAACGGELSFTAHLGTCFAFLDRHGLVGAQRPCLSFPACHFTPLAELSSLSDV